MLKDKLKIMFWGFIYADSLSDKLIYLKTSFRHALKYSFLKALSPKDLVISMMGKRIAFREFTGEIGCFKEIYKDKCYTLYSGFDPSNQKDKIIFDIGANIGLYTLQIATACPKCRIYSFEPNPEVFSRLSKNIGLNKLQNVKAYNIGFGERAGKAFMDFQESTVLGQVSYESGKYEIQLDTIDDFVDREKVTKIDILKIDAEGFELLILKSASKTLTITERIVMECSPQLEPEAEKLLLQYDFKPVLKLPQYNVIFFARKNNS